jgi:amino acid permease
MREPMADDKDWRRAALRRFLVPIAMAVAGIALVLATSGTAELVGAAVIALAVTVAVSLAFLEVGYSEDRARERGEQ